MTVLRSAEMFARSLNVFPSGVNSDFRHAFPRIFKYADGSHIIDVDGNKFIDYHMAFGAVLLGHRNKNVLAAVEAQLEQGDLWGMGSSEIEIRVGELIVQHVPSAEKVRFCNSGSEGTYHALRLARAYTRKRKVIKFEGSYNGWHDYLDIGVFPSVENLGKAPPNSAGILPEVREHTIVVDYNNTSAVVDAFRKHKGDVAAVIVEPILHSCGCILPKEGFLETLRELTTKEDTVLIFDEVITGFRHSIGGAQKLLNVTPDITVFGKALGNGFPIGGICGQKDILDQIQPKGDVHVAGTFSGHPVSMAAAKAVIEQLESGDVHESIARSGSFITAEIEKIITDTKVPATVASYKSIFSIYFTPTQPHDYRSLKMSNNESLFNIYCKRMHESGIFIPPQSYKRSHISLAHSKYDLEQTVEAGRRALEDCRISLRQ